MCASLTFAGRDRIYWNVKFYWFCPLYYCFLFCFIIQIFDGIYENQELLGTFCGYGLPPHIRSIGHSMSIQFVTDSSMGGIGFKLVYFQGNCFER